LGDNLCYHPHTALEAVIVSSMVIVSSAVWAEKNLLLRRVFDAPREGSAPLLRYISSITQRAAGAGAT